MTTHFDAFISYRQAAPDRDFAARLHRILETYTIPATLRIDRAPTLRVFRDREELRAGPLTTAIVDALAVSRKLFVLCSPKAAESTWVANEIASFLQSHALDDVVRIIIHNSPEATPSVLREAIAAALDHPPLTIDLTSNERPASSNALRRARLKLVAAAFGVDAAKLAAADLRRNIRRAAFAVTATLLTVASLITVRQTTLHFLAQRPTITFARGLNLFHPFLGSDQVFLETGMPVGVVSPELRARIEGRDWCSTLPFGPRRCSVLLSEHDIHTRTELGRDLLENLGSCRPDAPSLELALPLAPRLHLSPALVDTKVRQRMHCASIERLLTDARALADEPRYRAEAVEALRAHLHDRDPQAVVDAANLLVHQFKDQQQVAEALAPLVQNVKAACALLRVSPASHEAASVVWAQPLFDSASAGWLMCLGKSSPVDQERLDEIFRALHGDNLDRVRQAMFHIRFLQVTDERFIARIRGLQSDPRPELRLLAASKLLELGDASAQLALLDIVRNAPDVQDPLVPMQEPLFVRAAQPLLSTSLRSAAIDALRARMTEGHPLTVIAAAGALKDAGVRSAEMTSALRAAMRNAPDNALPSIVDLAYDLPGDKAEFTAAVDRAIDHYRAPTAGPPDQSFFDLATARALLVPRSAAIEDEIRELIGVNALAAPAYAWIVASANESDPNRAMSVLFAELRSRHGRRSAEYRAAVGERIAALATTPALRAQIVDRLLALATESEWPHERNEAHAILRTISLGVARPQQRHARPSISGGR